MSIPIGAQLYTLRNQLKTPEDIEKTLTRVAQIGYKYIQCSGFVFEPKRLRALCDRLGLQVKLTHTSPDRVLNDTQAVIEEHKILGCPYVGIGGLPGEFRTDGGGKAFLQAFQPAMQALQRANLKLQYHNHAFEFERYPSGRIFDDLISESDPAQLGFTLDVYWAHYAGVDVIDLIRKMKGRIDVCHYKDMAIADNQPRFAAIGSGNMNWDGIIGAFEEIGTEYAFIEQDDCYGLDPLDELEASFRFLQRYQ